VRILHLSWEYPPVMYGGLGRHVHALAETQAAMGDDVVVMSQSAEGAADDEILNGVRVIRVAPSAPNVPFDPTNLIGWVSGFNVALTRAGLSLMREWMPDVVHGHDWLVAQSAVILRDAAGPALVVTIHATEAGRHLGWLPTDVSRAVHSVEHWVTHEATRVIACSEHMRWEVQRLFDPAKGKTVVIPNGIDPDQWVVSSSRRARARKAYGTPLVVFAGRLEWEKGVHTLLEATSRLRRRVPGVRVVIAGRGGAEEALQRTAREKRLGRAVTFTGWMPEPDLRALIAAADAIVVPSIYEPFGIVALEAATLRTPLVVSRTGGLAELVEDGRTGWTFATGDATGLAAAVESALTDRAAARRYTAAARAAVLERHGWPAIAARTRLLYRDAVRAAEGGTPPPDRPPLRLVSDGGNLLTGLGG
jgi:glycogen(starch) synthase